jgi:hypothetical protein
MNRQLQRLGLGGLAAILTVLVVAFVLGRRHGDSGNPDSSGPPTAGAASGPPWFEDVTERVGLRFIHDPGPTDGSQFMPQIIGSGAALFDADGDGRLDIYLVQNGGPQGARNALYLQNPDGTFRDASTGSGLDVAGYGMGVAVADVDNDGRPDVLLTEFGATRLFRNEGGGHFREITKQAGIDNPLWGTSAAFFDYDRDGWLDLVVVNYLNLDAHQICRDGSGRRSYCHPNTFPGTTARLYRNRGVDNAGRWLGFEDRTDAAGFGARPGPGLGVVCADFTGDGWPDVFVANDAKPNHLWVNQKDGTFREEATTRGLALNMQGQAQGNMGVAVGDVDGDGLNDVFVTHLTSEYHSLWRQGPRGRFQESAAGAGLTRARWRGTGFGTVLADFDSDGWLDLAIVNGRVNRSPSATEASYWDPYQERNQLFVNDGRGNFSDVTADSPAFGDRAGVYRGLAIGDVDGDGAPDLLVTQIGGPARLFHNVAPRRGHWLMVRAMEEVGPRDAIGAEVQVRSGDRWWSRLIQPGQSYLCSNDPRAHFGLGPAAQIDEVVVLWADGRREAFPGGAVDCLRVIQRGRGRPAGKGGP